MAVNLASSLRGCRSWDDLRKRWQAYDKKTKGDLFEALVKNYLLLAPEFASKFKAVWGFKEIPNSVLQKLKLPSADKGIDLIAETKESDYWAIQCKYREESADQITWREISTFMGLYLGRTQISFGLVASTTERITKVLKDHDRVGFLAYDVWQGLDEGFFKRLQARLHKKKEPLKPRLPRPHQKEAIRDAVAYFSKKKQNRGKLIMPCGTGKSLTSYFIAQKLKARKVLIAVPSLALIRQTLKEWMRESMARGEAVEWICVCSDESAGKIEQDDISLLTQDLGIPCYTESNKIAAWLGRKRDSLTVVFTTYQSGDVLAKAARKTGFEFNLGIMDEAHKTTGAKERLFSYLLNEKNIKINKRIFMTATERRFKGASQEILSMEDREVYGDTFHKLSFKKALELNPAILSDYKVVTIHISKQEVADLIQNKNFVFLKEKKWRKEIGAETLAALIALRKGMSIYPIRHAVSFHSSVRRAREFQEINDSYSKVIRRSKPLKTFHISGKTPTGTRAKTIGEFINAPRALITNARCLTEGVDIPSVDTVIFADPKKSQIDIVQAVGRALRPYPGKKNGFVIVPVVHNAKNKWSDSLKPEGFQDVLTTLRALGSQDERIIEYFRNISLGKAKGKNKIIDGYISEKISKTIKLKPFIKNINLLCWSRLAKLSWRPFAEARRFARGLKISSSSQWYDYAKGLVNNKKKKPFDIPAAPELVYKNQGWNGYGDWLGTGTVQTQEREYLPYKDAQKIVLSKKLKNQKEWIKFTKTKSFPKSIPAGPAKVYKNNGWVNLGHWLGTNREATRFRKYRIFTDARKYVRSLKIRNQEEWRLLCNGNKPKKLPNDISKTPWTTYKNSGWNGLNDWLGTRPQGRRKFRSFLKARKWARSLQFKKQQEWYALCKGTKKIKLPVDIPSNPNFTYKGKGWKGYGDWLGTGNISKKYKTFLPFLKARKLIRRLKIKNVKEYIKYWNKTNKKTQKQQLPYSPHMTYKDKGWVSYPDWLGIKEYRKSSYKTAKNLVRRLKIRNLQEWHKITKKILNGYDEIDQRIPHKPNIVFQKKGWKGWSEWFGPQFLIGPKGKETLPFHLARKRVREMYLKNPKEYYLKWKQWPLTHPLKRGLPKTPQHSYLNKGWKDWADWLGSSYASVGKRSFLNYNEAKKVIKRLHIKTSNLWKQEVQNKKIPVNIPRQPKIFYLKKGWKGWGDFLGR